MAHRNKGDLQIETTTLSRSLEAAGGVSFANENETLTRVNENVRVETLSKRSAQ